MSEENKLPIKSDVDLSGLDNDINSVVQQLIEETDTETSKDLVHLFNWHLNKKNAIRLLKLSGLYDSITDQMIDRFQRRSGEFSNADLLNYLQTVENSMEKSKKSLSEVDTQPAIVQQNNTQINFNVLDGFDDDSKERIASAIKSILEGASSTEEQSPIIDTEYTEKNIDTNEIGESNE